MILALAALLLAADNPADAERAAWRYRRAVTIAGSEPLASLVLPPELSAKAGAFSRDLRLVDESGREVPYLLDWTSEREGLATWRVDVKDVRREKEEAREAAALRSQWTLDLGEARTFSDLALRVPDVAFAWHVRVEASLDGKGFEVIQPDAALFDQTWNNERVRRTEVRFEAPVTARYLRLTARSASDSRALEIDGASVTLRRRLKGDAWSMNVAAEPLAAPEGAGSRSTRYRLDASSLLPFDEVEIVCDDQAFSRRARLIEESGGNGKRTEARLGEGSIFRLRASDAVIAGESVRLPARSGQGGPLYLEIDDAGSPPLRGLKVRLHGSRVRLVFPVSGRSLTLYYGNEATRAPAYDIEGLRPRLAQAMGTAVAEIGPEEANPLFKRDPPLRFAATLGAPLDPSKWRRERPLSPITEEDVYAITLRAADLATLRPDLADLRVVNDDNKQVPFLVDADFADERVALKVQRQTAAPAHRSLFTLGPAEAVTGDPAPRVSRIEIEVSDAFFERPARILHSTNQTQREVPFSLTLSRKPPSSSLLVLGVSAPLDTMTLEVDDGDNAPLDIKSAVAIVRVPRIVFKAAPGNLRLLLGNRGAEAPRYDIAGLRSELLAYSAIAAHAGALGDNQASRPSLFSGFDTAPRGTLVWTAIIVAIIALVGLTLKTLKGA
ncbi:MAG TPA: DUF3999 family protein [Vicinamibacteria bacterium]|nr:DUF3999 family protein [Vicinamibacteria bacterium]